MIRHVGELIQHDTSYHFCAPAAQEKWYLIASQDDFSQLTLYATFVKQETSETHILALQTVILRHGFPYIYYVESYQISRFVQGRDSFRRKHHLLTHDTALQWKQVFEDCHVKIIHSSSRKATGKIEEYMVGSKID